MKAKLQALLERVRALAGQALPVVQQAAAVLRPHAIYIAGGFAAGVLAGLLI